VSDSVREAFEKARELAWQNRKRGFPTAGLVIPRSPSFDEWFEAGWQAQQERIDELEQQLDKLKFQAYELMGVIYDVENSGFDDVCLETIKRVRDVLLGKES
jgi:hypothetical protein